MAVVDVKAGHVSRETVRRHIDDAASFPDAEIPENPVEDLFHINPAGDPAQRPGGQAKVLGYEFRCGGSGGARQDGAAFLQGLAVALPRVIRALPTVYTQPHPP